MDEVFSLMGVMIKASFAQLVAVPVQASCQTLLGIERLSIFGQQILDHLGLLIEVVVQNVWFRLSCVVTFVGHRSGIAVGVENVFSEHYKS